MFTFAMLFLGPSTLWQDALLCGNVYTSNRMPPTTADSNDSAGPSNIPKPDAKVILDPCFLPQGRVRWIRGARLVYLFPSCSLSTKV